MKGIPKGFADRLPPGVGYLPASPGRNIFYVASRQGIAAVGVDAKVDRWSAFQGTMTAQGRSFGVEERLADIRSIAALDLGLMQHEIVPLLWMPRSVFEMDDLPSQGKVIFGGVSALAVKQILEVLSRDGTGVSGGHAESVLQRATQGRHGALDRFIAEVLDDAEESPVPEVEALVERGKVVRLIGADGVPFNLAGVMTLDSRDVETSDEFRGNPLASDMRRYMADGLRLAGPGDEDGLDMLLASFRRDAPWLVPSVSEILLRSRAAVKEGARWFEIEPTLLVGPSGSGKSWLAKELSVRTGLPSRTLDAGTASSLAPFVGMDSGWRNAAPSEIVSVMASEGVANPVIVVDGVDRRGSVDPLKALLPFLDTGASELYDQFLKANLDMRYVGWVFIANDRSRLPRPFLDRCLIVEVPLPSTVEMADFARRRALAAGLDMDAVDALVDAVRKGRPTLHRIERAIRAVKGVVSAPVLH